MKVIGAGFGRTGTMSLKVALQQIGFGPCLHMIDLLAETPELSDAFREAYGGKKTDWPSTLQRFHSIVDWPGCSFYKQLMDAFPEAPVILTLRDPEAWYKSTNDTIYGAAQTIIAMPEMADQPVTKMIKAVVWDGDLEGRFEDKQRAIAIYQRHNQEVQDYVPAHKLLVFEVKQGWEPLCRFLGVDIPDGPFPHVNDTESFNENMRSGAITSGEEARRLNRS